MKPRCKPKNGNSWSTGVLPRHRSRTARASSTLGHRTLLYAKKRNFFTGAINASRSHLGQHQVRTRGTHQGGGKGLAPRAADHHQHGQKFPCRGASPGTNNCRRRTTGRHQRHGFDEPTPPERWASLCMLVPMPPSKQFNRFNKLM